MRAKPGLIGLIWPFVTVVLAQLLVAAVSLHTMSAVRTYIGGESLWSKGQKDAIYFLHRYADTGEEAHFRRFAEAIAVPLADHDARLALDRGETGTRVSERFAAGGIHADDISGVIWLYRNFNGVGYLARSIAYWKQADIIVLDLDALGRTIHREFAEGSATPAVLATRKAEIARINSKITPLAHNFSRSLGEGSRFITSVLIWVNVISAALLIMLAVWRTAKHLRQTRAYERALKSEKERVQVTLASIGEAVISTDAQGRLDFMNPVAERLIGWGTADALGKPLASLFRIVDQDTGADDTDLVRRILGGEVVAGGDMPQLLVRADMSATAVSFVGSPLRIEGVTVGAVLVLHDKTAEQQYIAKLSFQATHDALTGLANRREFEERLGKALAFDSPSAGQHALMFLDLDQFKVVNDTCGHAAGDQLLREVSAALLARLGASDLLARLGGDEFGIILGGRSLEKSAEVAETLRTAVQELNFAWSGRPFTISASIGLVHASAARFTCEEMLRAADVACYMAKEKGRNRVQLHRPGDTEVMRRVGEMAWVQRLHRAIEENRLCLYAQDIVPLKAGQDEMGSHVELLLRLRDETGRMVMPGAFIPAAERYGLMPLIDRWVVRSAFACLAARRAAGAAGPGTCAINLSGATLGDASFVDYVRQQMAIHRIAAETICFELTETSAIADMASAERFIAALKALGCRFSLDDFGTGMSSFAYLKHLPVDYLKIDGSFVRDMLHNRIDRAMVEMIAHIGEVTGKRTIAEFVEDQPTIDILRDVGIDYAQGHAIGRPRPFDAATVLAAPPKQDIRFTRPRKRRAA